MPLLTKAPFLDAQTCPAKGWFTQHQGTGAPSWDLQWRFFQGKEVHQLAAEWSGPGMALRRTSVEEAAEATRAAMAVGGPDQLFEATFAALGCVARADIVRRGDGGWIIVEVKSGQSPKPGEEPSDDYLNDLAYTVMVAQAAQVSVMAAHLLLVNRDFRLGMPDATRFSEHDVTGPVMLRAAAFAGELATLVPAVAADQTPAATLIPACKACDYFETDCLGREIPDPIFLIPNLRGARFEALAPYLRIANVPPDPDLTDNQRVVFEVLRSGVPRANQAVLQQLDRLVWPAHYLDFETAMPALPWHEGDAPYATLLTQYSLHIVDRSGAEPRHLEYLAALDTDWRRELVERLLDALGERGSIVVYSSYEQQRLNEAAELFPDLAPRLAAAVARLFDLEPFFRKGYLHPGFRGRSSIKATLPVMVPELTYAGLPVGNGGDAAGLVALMKVGQVPEAEHARHRRDLLEYCKLDTMAMVRLHEALLALVGE